MADESIYTVEERIVIKDHILGKQWATSETISPLRLSKAAPPTMTILRWEKKLFETDSIKDT
jgi:hypothetical protein